MPKSKKLMSKNDIKEFVKKNGEYQLYKNDLIELYKEVYEKNPPRGCTKSDLWKDICKKANLYDIYEKYKNDCCFGMSVFEIEERFNIDKTQRKKLQKKGILEVAYTVEIKKSGYYINAPYYSLDCLHKLDKEEFYRLAEENKKKEPTEKQLQAWERSREGIKCECCGTRVKRRADLTEGLCTHCFYNLKIQEMTRREIKEMFDNKDKYVILDTETTGLYEDDEVIEIAIIDLDGNVLLNTRINTDIPISEGAYEVHHIKKEDLKDKPYFKDINDTVSKILKGKEVLIFNASFDTEKMMQSGYTGEINSMCLMELYRTYMNAAYRISLQNALSYQSINIVQDHSALGDCICCLELLKSMVKEKWLHLL